MEVELKEKELKDQKIAKEIKRLSKAFKDIDGKKKDLARDLIKNAAFMSIALEELAETIKIKGYVEEYQNGANQKGVKKSSEMEIYNSTIKNFNQTIKQLNELLPSEVKQTLGDKQKEEEDKWKTMLNRGR